MTVGLKHWAPNMTDGEKSSLNLASNPGPLAYRVSTLTTELLRPDILTDSHIPVNPMTCIVCEYNRMSLQGNPFIYV